jgi:hypothetical protein
MGLPSAQRRMTHAASTAAVPTSRAAVRGDVGGVRLAGHSPVRHSATASASGAASHVPMRISAELSSTWAHEPRAFEPRALRPNRTAPGLHMPRAERAPTAGLNMATGRLEPLMPMLRPPATAPMTSASGGRAAQFYSPRQALTSDGAGRSMPSTSYRRAKPSRAPQTAAARTSGYGALLRIGAAPAEHRSHSPQVPSPQRSITGAEILRVGPPPSSPPLSPLPPSPDEADMSLDVLLSAEAPSVVPPWASGRPAALSRAEAGGCSRGGRAAHEESVGEHELDARVAGELNAWWAVVLAHKRAHGKATSGGLDRVTYFEVFLNIFKATVAVYDEREAMRAVAADWEADSGGAAELSEEAFKRVMLELAATSATGASVQKRAAFLRGLLRAVTEAEGPGENVRRALRSLVRIKPGAGRRAGRARAP